MKNRFFFITLLAFSTLCANGQPKMGGGGNGANAPEMWVDINKMSVSTREKITQAAEEMQQSGGATRSVLTDVLTAAGFGGVSAVIDVATTETIHLATYRKEQKRKWMKMIENEDNYTDNISSIKGLKDFYSQPSRNGAFDPSNINFDGISIRGCRNGEEMLYISCHMDTTRLDHLFQHGRFYLVVDSIVFYPYKCHLPNLAANDIRIKGDEQSERDNSFSYDERTNLNVGMEFTLSSSWVNEAVFIQKNVELGTFKLNISVPDGTDVYRYSRRAVERNKLLMRDDPALGLDTTAVQMEGDCYIVPRSYMPVNGEEKMWGTGEYNINVKFRESCQFKDDTPYNEKLKHWRKDYRQLRKMQKKGGEFNEYFKELWQQNGTTLMKTVIKQGLTTGASELGLSSSAVGGGVQGSAGGQAQTGGRL